MPRSRLLLIAAAPLIAAPAVATALPATALPANGIPGAATARVPGRTALSPTGVANSPKGNGYTPKQIQAIYRIPRTKHPQRVAIITANQIGDVESELKTYRSTFHLRPCTTRNHCFRSYQVSENDPEAKAIDLGLIALRADNTAETALDVEAVSAMCPECHIDLVSAEGNANTSTSGAIYFATHHLRDKVVSFSYSGQESGTRSNAKADDAAVARDVPRGHTLFVSSGDTGGGNSAGPSAPGDDPRVVSVGGTSVRHKHGRWVTKAWNGTTTGCSHEFKRPAYQRHARTGCSGRAETDVSALADPNTGFATFVGSNGVGAWTEVGGTSLATPLVAAMTARLGQGGRVGPATFYRNARRLLDVTRGNSLSHGSCGGAPRQECVASKGWDGPTGNGTPRGPGGFTGR